MTRPRSFVATLFAIIAGVGFAGAISATTQQAKSASATLTIVRAGSGSGSVTGSVGAISCGATCSADIATGTSITLTATPDASSQFTGWLGPCTGAGICEFTINDTTTAVATFAPAALGAATLDIDGSTAIEAPTDGILVFRYLLGLSGASLTGGALAPGAARTTDAQIGDYLTNIKPALDIDGNGEADALTDGLLIVRYLLGRRGDGLIAGAVGPGATRTTAVDIEASLLIVTTQLPPDPATVAPPLDPTATTSIFAGTTFIYTGPAPIQTGVAPGTINVIRAAVVRGRVLSNTGTPLSGVAVTVFKHPEFGQTLSRADGMFDLVVNGGGLLTLTFRKSGLASAQRQVNAPLQDYVRVPDVGLIPLDSKVTQVDLASATVQVAQANPATDADGTRQATILFPAGTLATMTLANGSTTGLANFHVRATEFTVGANGPRTMPASLPPSSGFTYEVEYSVDEADAAGATRVDFSNSLISYTENFLGFPVGTLVPSGEYDRTKAMWIATTNGRVIKILGVAQGQAVLDIDGSGIPASASALAALGVGTDELVKLAILYPIGQTLWRVPIDHFLAMN